MYKRQALYPVVEDNQEVAITTLLPLSLYITNINKDKYKELLQGQYTVINPNGHTKNFTVSEVSVCCEGFSSLMTKPELLSEAIYLIEVGGVDLAGCFVNRTPVVAQSFTSEMGMNIFYTELAKVLTSKLLESYNNKDAELLYNKYEVLEDDLKPVSYTHLAVYKRQI